MVDIDTLSRVAMMPRSTLQTWAYGGVTPPARKGSKGKGRATLFSAQQCFGIACGWACRKVTQCDRETVHAWYKRAEKIPDAAMVEWLTGEASPWSEERANYLNAAASAYDIEAVLQAEIVAVGDRILKHLSERMRGTATKRFRRGPLPQPGTLDEVR
jgi:hypothetical protein